VNDGTTFITLSADYAESPSALSDVALVNCRVRGPRSELVAALPNFEPHFPRRKISPRDSAKYLARGYQVERQTTLLVSYTVTLLPAAFSFGTVYIGREQRHADSPQEALTYVLLAALSPLEASLRAPPRSALAPFVAETAWEYASRTLSH